MAQAWNLWGDGTSFGVSAPGGSDYPQALRALAAAGEGAPAGVACHLGALERIPFSPDHSLRS
jgi:hypothetical protein